MAQAMSRFRRRTGDASGVGAAQFLAEDVVLPIVEGMGGLAPPKEDEFAEDEEPVDVDELWEEVELDVVVVCI